MLLPLRDIDRLARQLRALEWLGRWSLYDVLALALTIALIQSQSAFEAGNATGIYCFTGAVLLMLLAHAWLRNDVAASRMHLPATKRAYSSAMRGAAFNLLVLLAAGLFVPRRDAAGDPPSRRLRGTDQHSAASLLQALYGRGELFPGLVLFALAILLPGMKLLYLLAVIAARLLPYALRVRSILAIEWLGGYSIAEIMVLALMVFYLGASDRAGILILPGAYCFAGSALLTMAAFGWANALGRRRCPPYELASPACRGRTDSGAARRARARIGRCRRCGAGRVTRGGPQSPLIGRRPGIAPRRYRL